MSRCSRRLRAASPSPSRAAASRLTSRVPARRGRRRRRRRLCRGAYVLLAGAQVPAVRTPLMLAVAAIGFWSHARARPIVWLWALAVVLDWDPWAALTPGFWLSFGAVGAPALRQVGRLTRRRRPSWRRAVRACAARGRAHAAGRHDRARSRNARAVPAGVARVAARQRARDSDRHVCSRAACADGIVLPIDLLFRGGACGVRRADGSARTACRACRTRRGSSMRRRLGRSSWRSPASRGSRRPRGVPGRLLGALALVPLFVVRPVRLRPARSG